jgi:RNA polymerase sigma-70 factor (ECF subfamily)
LSHAYRICGNTPAAQDAVQDTFISAYTHIDSLKNHALLYPWLKKILVNNCYQQLRRDRSVELSDVVMNKEIFTESSIQMQLEKMTDQWRMFDSLRELSEELRICILLRYFTELNSYDAIALVLGIPIGTVRSRLSAAREKLINNFNKNPDSTDAALKEGASWSGYYLDLYRKFYDDMNARKELFDHHHKDLNLRFTSGKTAKGRKLVEKEIDDDLFFGSRFQVREVISSGNISVVEGMNVNHIRYPDRCAPMTTMVLFRKDEQINTLHIFDSERKK